MCPYEGCSNKIRSRGYCIPHYKKLLKDGKIDAVRIASYKGVSCSLDDCDTQAKKRGWCEKHYDRWRANGDPTVTKIPNKGKDQYRSRDGYVWCHRPGHPMANVGGQIMVHRIVMSEHLGRLLTKGENVHHINGDRADNRIENLELWNTSQPAGQRIEDKVAWAKEILALYDPDSLK